MGIRLPVERASWSEKFARFVEFDVSGEELDIAMSFQEFILRRDKIPFVESVCNCTIRAPGLL